MMPFRTILCPVDFSGPSRIALRYAAVVARMAGARMIVLFVNDPLLAAAAAATYDAQAVAHSTDVELKRFVRKALAGRRVPAASVRMSVAVGKPAQEIATAAEQLRADLVVMGTRGLSGAARLVLGSTTEQVLRRAGVPVLAVPPRAARLVRSKRTPR
jgi:nucleotide-binding universal stress UspA family protein